MPFKIDRARMKLIYTVTTQIHSSSGINTNKAKTTTRTITVVDTWYWSINKTYYIIIFVHENLICITTCYKIGKNHSLWKYIVI